MQVGVWIPKAKAGPEADNFRPLGMPNTLDRLVDGSVASHVMQQTAHLMHPSQAVMSCFKEPQKAVSCIQAILDGDSSACTLLADLSKAFERVNPHWLLELLRIKRAPRWLIAYTKFILFHRRVTHKVQGRLLPSRTIMQGVDMARSFSVYLFCFTYLNRIPGVLSVQGYIDDTSIIGNAQDLDWLLRVAECYSSLRTAGFIVDSHRCFRACTVINNRSLPVKCLSDVVESTWPGLLMSPSFATAWDALNAHARPGYNTVVVRVGESEEMPLVPGHPCRLTCIVAVFSYQQIMEIRAGVHMHELGAFATIKCKCKSKSNLLTNSVLRPLAVKKIEVSGFGVQAVCHHAPSLGLSLVGRYQFNEHGSFDRVEAVIGLGQFNSAPLRKLVDRLKSFSRPTLSIMARCTGFNTFILSVMPYTISYFGLASTDLNRLRQAAAKFILKRHWIESEILPYVLRYVGIATLLDPALSATVAATGLYLREGNPVEDLAGPSEGDGCCNGRQRSVVLGLLRMWHPFLCFEDLFTALSEGNRIVPKRLEALKKTIIRGMLSEARSRISRKIVNEGWSGGIDLAWIDLVVHAPRAWCNGIADVWLSMRGTRHQQKCGTCGLPGDAFPFGYYRPPWCEACIRVARLDAWGIEPWSSQLYCASVSDQSPSEVSQWKQQWSIQPANEVVCRACGCGDNTVGHWTRWCVVPLIVASAILQPSVCPPSLQHFAACNPRHAAVCALVLASFRRLLRQEGAFLRQCAAEPKDVTWWIAKLHEMVAQDAHIELQVPFPMSLGASGRCSLCSDKVAVQRILPLEYSTMHLPPFVGVCTTGVPCNDQVAVLPLSSAVAAALKEMESSNLTMQSNVTVGLVHCACGGFQVQLVAAADICSGDVLVPTRSCPPRILSN